MIVYSGKNGKTATVMLGELDAATAAQIQSIVAHPVLMESPVIMPDCHAGKGCVVGYTCKTEKAIIPNLIGVDIGCGMHLTKFPKIPHLDRVELDKYVRKNIPMGMTAHSRQNISGDLVAKVREVAIRIGAKDSTDYFINSLGTLGGGNHFIELDEGVDGYYIVIHSGSRNFGKMVAEFYQKLAVGARGGASRPQNASGKGFKAGIPEDQAYLLPEEGGDDYLWAMKVAQEYAVVNRLLMANRIQDYFQVMHGARPLESYSCIHNYINFEDGYTRKGAISAHEGEKVIIPLNMRDGIILGIGKGNPTWNYSAPHGAGRIKSRAQAKKDIDFKDYQETMKGVYSTSVCQETLDESPFAYKDAQMIIDAIGDTVQITEVIKPLWVIKAAEKKERK